MPGRITDPAHFPIPRNQTAALSLIARQVVKGYLWHRMQPISLPKILSVLEELGEKHGALISPQKRHVHRKAGLPVAYVVLAPEPRDGKWPLALLATQKLPGEEMYRIDDSQHPLLWPAFRDGQWRPTYQLSFDEGFLRWTWKLTEEVYYALLEEALDYALRRDWSRLSTHLRQLGSFHPPMGYTYR